ncbi:MAG: GNAT family N-acetyltransferase [Roseobacter sp.]|jgi:GNAT superfamily N-acetyltransferase|nr:GNAT family N-acetyltransferase [Roseobacter sp.]
MAVETRVLTGRALVKALPGVAALRIEVFREWPYLYDGNLAYEERYLAPYADTADAVLVGAFDRGRLVGASTGMPLCKHADGFATAFATTDIDPETVFYCAESVLLSPYRGQGAGHAFFDLREAAARQMGFAISAFCAVERPADHPARPADYRPLDSFWHARGYRPVPGAMAGFDWKDLGAAKETCKQLQFWAMTL